MNLIIIKNIEYRYLLYDLKEFIISSFKYYFINSIFYLHLSGLSLEK